MKYTMVKHQNSKWIVLFAGTFTVFVSYGIRYGYGILLPEMLKYLVISKTEAGIIYSFYLISYTIFSPITGMLTDRLGPQRIITLFCGALGIGTFLMGTVTSLEAACIFFFVAGLGAAACWVPIVVLVQSWFGEKRRGTVLGVMGGGASWGFGSMGLLLPILISWSSWRVCWYILGIMAFFLVLVNGILPKRPAIDSSMSSAEPSLKSSERSIKPQLKAIYGETVLTKKFWLIGISYLFISFAIMVPLTFLTTYAVIELNFEYTLSAAFSSIMAFSGILGALLLSLLSDRIGRRNTIIVCNFLAGIGLFAIILARANVAAMTLCISVMGLSYGGIWPQYATCAFDYFSQGIAGTVVGLWTVCCGVGITFSPLVSGYIADQMATFVWTFILAAFMAIMSIALIIPLKPLIRH